MSGEAARSRLDPGLALVIVVVALIACTVKEPARADSSDAPSAPEAARNRTLVTISEKTARFLAGEIDFDSLSLADSVDLYLAPEGGGGRARLSRERLRDRAAWRVRSGSIVRSFVPASSQRETRSSIGHHMRCTETSLAPLFPALSKSPHVGVRRAPPGSASCLQTWNVTFVFDTAAVTPRIVAAIYDQWEW
jgi:hypothetical protein